MSRRGGGLAGGLGLAVLLAVGACADGGGTAGRADGGAGGPPQYLPVSARWCLPEGACVGLEVPKLPRQYAWGLQMRPALPPLRGMWFSFSPPAPARFWMHRTLAPLDMVFVRDGRVVAIEAAVPPCARLPCPSYGPVLPVDGVVELGAGRAAALGIGVGTPVRIESLTPSFPAAPARD
ncbi:MAG: DUF192 domain-containing protein [Synechococcaceae cyanobacterium]|nr:DUF192 domain-containing protein [Synechococcaceae cyanobacterium]